jgi:hypothetical protein
MRDVHEVLDQKERELLKCRMDFLALLRVASLLADPEDYLDALGALNLLRVRLDQSS